MWIKELWDYRELLYFLALRDVKVRYKLATLAVNERNRGLLFDPEMVQLCGRQFKVLRRVKQIIDDRTMKMVKMKGDYLILDGVTCESDYHFFCPRSIYPYWREIWLRRVGDPARGD